MKNIFLFTIAGIVFAMTVCFVPTANAASHETTSFEVSQMYQPDFDHPHKFSRLEMDALAKEVLEKIQTKINTPFDRTNIEHVQALAEFFALTPRADLDPYSTPMEEPDMEYFVAVEENKQKELYPRDTRDLVIRFYWEGLARVTAAHYKLEVVNEKRAARPVKSRGKVSDIATTGMFDKKPRMSIAQAEAQSKDRYDFGRLISHLKVKGLKKS